MPKTNRDNIKRLIAQAWINMDFAGKYISQVADMYRQPHPEEAEQLDLACTGILLLEDVLQDFVLRNYMIDNPDWGTMAGRGVPLFETVSSDIKKGDKP